MRVINLLRLQGLPILQQLRLEEALLRADAGNWCILNDGSATTAVVLGISGCGALLPGIKRLCAGPTVKYAGKRCRCLA